MANNTNKLHLIREMVDTAQSALATAKQLVEELQSKGPAGSSVSHLSAPGGTVFYDEEGNPNVIEGVFDGQNMIGTDGKKYAVPPNYASKSKLVEGDRMKLTIGFDGSFIYKQIGPIDRARKVGTVAKDETGEFNIIVNDKTYKVLLASITFYKASLGDKAVILLPKNHEAIWATMENVVRADQAENILERVELSDPNEPFTTEEDLLPGE